MLVLITRRTSLLENVWKRSVKLCSLAAYGSVFYCAEAVAAPPAKETEGSELTPSLKVEGVYRSNVYLQEGEVGGGAPTVSGVHIFVRPELELVLKDSSAVHLNLNAGYAARKFLTEGLSNLDRYKDFDLRAGVQVAPKGKLGLTIQDKLSLRGYETEAYYADTAYIERLDNVARGTINLRPGPDLELKGGGGLEYEDYRNDTGTSDLSTPNLNTRLAYGPIGSLSWKFIPKTAFVANYNYTWFYWRDNFVVSQGDGLSGTDDLGDRIGIPDGTTSQFTMGLRGRFTRRLVLGMVGGVTSMTYDENSVIEDASDDQIDGSSTDIDTDSEGFGKDLQIRCADEDIYCTGFPGSVTAIVDLAYELNDSNSLNLSYRRDFQDVYFTNYVAFHQVAAVLELLMWNRWSMTSGLNYRFEDYEGEVDRSDHLIQAYLENGILLTDSLTLDLGTRWTRRASASSGTSGDRNPYIEFDDINVHGGLTFSY